MEKCQCSHCIIAGIHLPNGVTEHTCFIRGCSEAFEDVKLHRKHMLTHSKPFSCNYEDCDKNYNTMASLSRHRETHTPKPTYVCSECGKGFFLTEGLTKHLRTHDGQKNQVRTRTPVVSRKRKAESLDATFGESVQEESMTDNTVEEENASHIKEDDGQREGVTPKKKKKINLAPVAQTNRKRGRPRKKKKDVDSETPEMDADSKDESASNMSEDGKEEGSSRTSDQEDSMPKKRKKPKKNVLEDEETPSSHKEEKKKQSKKKKKAKTEAARDESASLLSEDGGNSSFLEAVEQSEERALKKKKKKKLKTKADREKNLTKVTESENATSSDSTAREHQDKTPIAKKRLMLKCKNGTLEDGLCGFLCTSTKNREQECYEEAIGLLRYFAERIYGPETESASDNETPVGRTLPPYDDEVEIDIKKEIIRINGVSPGRRPRFSKVDTGIANLLFIETRLADPDDIATTIFEEIISSKQLVTKHFLNLVPVEATCKATKEEIAKVAAEDVFPKYIASDPTTFTIRFRSLNNSNIKKKEVVASLKRVLHEQFPNCRPDNKSPQIHIVVEVLQNICCLAVLPHFERFRKYNLVQVAKHGAVSPPSVDAAVTVEEVVEDTDGEAVNKEVTEDVKSPRIKTDEMDESVDVDVDLAVVNTNKNSGVAIEVCVEEKCGSQSTANENNDFMDTPVSNVKIDVDTDANVDFVVPRSDENETGIAVEKAEKKIDVVAVLDRAPLNEDVDVSLSLEAVNEDTDGTDTQVLCDEDVSVDCCVASEVPTLSNGGVDVTDTQLSNSEIETVDRAAKIIKLDEVVEEEVTTMETDVVVKSNVSPGGENENNVDPEKFKDETRVVDTTLGNTLANNITDVVDLHLKNGETDSVDVGLQNNEVNILLRSGVQNSDTDVVGNPDVKCGELENGVGVEEVADIVNGSVDLEVMNDDINSVNNQSAVKCETDIVDSFSATKCKNDSASSGDVGEKINELVNPAVTEEKTCVSVDPEGC